MQLALSPSPAAPGSGTGARQSTRMNKFVIGGVAALSASVIAVNPISPNAAALELQQRAVQLAASVTDSPVAVYGDLVTNSIRNVSTLAAQFAANPFPILSTILENQVGYVGRVGTSIDAAGVAFETWWTVGTRESPPGKTLLANAQTAIAAGNFGEAWNQINRLGLFALQNTILPILNGTIFSSATVPGIPEQMVLNYAAAVGSFFSTGSLIFGATQSIWAPLSGSAFEASRAIEAITKALGAGDPLKAATALVNTPGQVLNAFLNGFDFDSTDARETWSGLLSPRGTDARPASGGPLSFFGITLPSRIADAISNATPVIPAATAASGVAVTSIALNSSDSAGQTFDLTVGDAGAVVPAAASTEDAAVTETETDDAAATDTEPAASTDDAAVTETETDDAAVTETETDDAAATETDSDDADSAKTDASEKSASDDSSAAEGAKDSDRSAKHTKADASEKSAKSDTGSDS